MQELQLIFKNGYHYKNCYYQISSNYYGFRILHLLLLMLKKITLRYLYSEMGENLNIFESSLNPFSDFTFLNNIQNSNLYYKITNIIIILK